MRIERLDDVTMDEVHLTTPVSAEAIRSLKLGDVVYLSGALYTAREAVYRQVVEKDVPLPEAVRALTNVNFHCSPAASVRPDGSYAVQAVTATASFRFGKSMATWFERSGAKVIVGKAGLTELAYREWFVPHGAVYLTTVGYGLGAMYGRAIKGVLDVHWLKELGIAQALWVLEVDRIGPFLVEGDAQGRSLFALANHEINLRLDEVYKNLPPPALARFGEVLSRKDEVV
jgi:L(+)-tartrate dehydratase beta subunit